MILLADSGATKTDWAVVVQGKVPLLFSTEGLNPVFSSESDIVKVLEKEVLPQLECQPDEVHFYGSGVIDSSMADCLRSVFPKSEITCESDMMGAAKAVCGNSPGIVCILGTGSNSCFYDGEKIADNVKAGGFILGDEASGAYMGKMLLSDFVKGLVPEELEKELETKYGLDYPTIVQKVYKEPLPSRFLASFSPFILEHSSHPYIANLIKSSFDAFLQRNITHYQYGKYAVNFVGSIAFSYREYLKEAVGGRKMVPGRIIRKPIEGLIEYYGKR